MCASKAKQDGARRVHVCINSKRREAGGEKATHVCASRCLVVAGERKQCLCAADPTKHHEHAGMRAVQ